MTPEQLASARATHWREDAQPILTLDDAKAWLERMQLCLYLPRKTHVLAPAPSFVGAVLGQSSATPPPETIQLAHDLLVRLVTEGFVVPLNLFGTPGEQPDFLVLTSALPQLAALQGDRNWKKAPTRTGPGKVSPLAIEIWKLLEREGALTATEIRTHLGHELTEAATIRGLSELWQNLRVAPLPQPDGEAANWEILSVTHKKEMAAGGTLSQSTALSLLVSYYVQSVLTATAEDIEAFLSPVASRSRLRDVIRGLGATRQLKTLSMDAQTFFFLEGTLPDMPEVAAEAPAADKPAFMGRSAYRERMLNKGKGEDEDKKEDTSPSTYKERRGETGPSRSADRPRRPAFDRPRTGPPRRDVGRQTDRPSRFAAGGSSSRPSRPSFGDRARGASSDRPPYRGKPAEGARPFRPRAEGDRPFTPRPFTPRDGSSRPPFRKTGSEGRPFAPRPFTPRDGSSRPPYRGRPAEGGARPFRPRTDGDRSRSGPPGSERSGDRSFRKPSSEGRPFTPRPFTPREGSARPPFRGKPADAGARPFRPRAEGDRPRNGPPRGDKPFRKPGGEGRPFTPREGSSRPPFRGKPAEGGARPFRPRTEGDRPRSGPPRTERSGDKPFRKPSGEGRPFAPRPSGGRESSSRPPFRGKPAEGSARPFRPRTEGGGPERPGRSPRPAGKFVKREGPPSSGRPPARPGSRPGAPGRNPGGTGRPKFGPPRSGPPRSGPPRSGAGARPAGRPSSSRPSSPRPGGLHPPTRKPRKEKDSE